MHSAAMFEFIAFFINHLLFFIFIVLIVLCLSVRIFCHFFYLPFVLTLVFRSNRVALRQFEAVSGRDYSDSSRCATILDFHSCDPSQERVRKDDEDETVSTI